MLTYWMNVYLLCCTYYKFFMKDCKAVMVCSGSSGAVFYGSVKKELLEVVNMVV